MIILNTVLSVSLIVTVMRHLIKNSRDIKITEIGTSIYVNYTTFCTISH